MSAIQFIREKAGVLVSALIALALLLFIVGDMFNSGSGQNRKIKKYYELGEIDGEYISYQDFETRVQSLVEIYKLSGTSNIDESMYETIRENIWQQMVRETILDSQYEKLGIGVSTEELDELVLGDNPHNIVRQLFTDQSTGLYNKSFLVSFLKQIDLDETAKKYWLFFEDEIVNDRTNTKYNSLISKGLYVTSKMAEFDSKINKRTVDFSFITGKYSSIPDSAVVLTRSDVESYYNAHKKQYKRNPLRSIEYVTFDINPSQEDIDKTRSWAVENMADFSTTNDPVQFVNLSADTRYTGYYQTMDEVPDSLKAFAKQGDKTKVYGPYEENGSFKIARIVDIASRPDSVHVRHILIANNAKGRNKQQAETLADSIYTMVKNKRKSFESYALTSSDDAGSAQIGGDLGWFSEGTMILPFNNACFSGKKGDIVKIESTYGIHIIEILDQSKKVKKYNIAIVDRKIAPSTSTYTAIYNKASEFAGKNNTYELFNKAITEQNMNKHIANDVMPNQKTLPGLTNPRQLVMSLYSADEGKIILDNNQQAIFEIGDQYVVAFCTKVQEAGIAPMKNVEKDILFRLIIDKKAEKLISEFNKNSEGKTLEDVANTMNLDIQEASQINFRSYIIQGIAGAEPALIAASTVAEKDKLAGPVKGNNGVFMINVNNSSEGEEPDLELLKKQLSYSYQMRGFYEAYEAMKNSVEIVDKRYKFY